MHKPESAQEKLGNNYARVRWVLKKLVALKKYKEKNGKDARYKIDREELWKKADEILKSTEENK